MTYIPATTPAPTNATYLTQTADATLTNEQAMGALPTGLVKNTTGTGVQSIGVAGTDFQAPLGPSPTFAGLTVSVNQNAATFITAINTTDGTTARTYYVAETASSKQISMQAVSASFTLVADWAAAGIIYSNCTNLQIINDDASGIVRFKIGGTGSANEKARLLSTGNLKLAGTAARATTEGTNHLDIFNGAAPVGTLANGISLYSTAGELRVMDASGAPTLLSPHDKDGYWIFESRSGRTGRMFRVHMERLMWKLDWVFRLFGSRLIEEF